MAAPIITTARQERDELARRFVAACSDGEFDGLIEFLAPRRRSPATAAARRPGLPDPIVGAVKGARLLIGAFDKLRDHGIQIEHVHVGGHPALRMHSPTNETIAIWSLLITDSTIVAIHGVVNPDSTQRECLREYPEAVCSASGDRLRALYRRPCTGGPATGGSWGTVGQKGGGSSAGGWGGVVGWVMGPRAGGTVV